MTSTHFNSAATGDFLCWLWANLSTISRNKAYYEAIKFIYEYKTTSFMDALITVPRSKKVKSATGVGVRTSCAYGRPLAVPSQAKEPIGK